MKSTFLTILSIFLINLTLSAQSFGLKNGHETNASGDLRVLIVFAELDCTNCPPPNTGTNICGDAVNDPYPESSLWPEGELPANVENWILPELLDDEIPQQGYVTKYYHAASLGNFKLVGDFFHAPVKVDCQNYTNAGQGRVAVFDQLNQEIANGNPDFQSTYLGNFSSWQYFDNIDSEGNHGVLKSGSSNGRVDCVAIIWRNNPDASDFGFVEANVNIPMLQMVDDVNMASVAIVGNWKDPHGYLYDLFVGEFLHALYGGNNWHMGSGAGQHTFMGNSSSYGISAQSAGASIMACGWDRWALDWRPYDWDNAPPGAGSLPIRAVNESGDAVDTDLNTPCQNEQIFVLRDFYKTGDAIRIKLPHLDFPISATHDMKNQYLWIENHQRISEWDRSKAEGASCKESWSNGLYAYLQVGKDIIASNDQNKLYPEHISGPSENRIVEPNYLASWLMPLTAEGHYDFHYRTDLEGQDMNNASCIWGNRYLPIETDSPNTLPNSFTGASELYNVPIDRNNSGRINGTSGNSEAQGQDYWYVTGTAEITNGATTPTFNLFKLGDGADAFQLNGNNKIGIATNPSSMPIYTHISGSGLKENDNPNGPNEIWENRTIFLNGISIEILEETFNPNITDDDGNGSFDLKVRVRWDDYLVDQDTRWCGNIILQQDNDVACSNWQSKIIIDDDIEISLDQGRTPTKYFGDVQPDGSYLFAENTTLTISEGTMLHMKDRSRIVVKNNSTLIIEEGAEVLLEQHACIVVEETGTLHLKGNNITLNGDGSVIILKGDLKTDANVDFTFEGPGYIDMHPTNSISLGYNSNFVIERPGTPTKERFINIRDNTLMGIGAHELRLKNGKVLYGNNAEITVGSGSIDVRATVFEGADATSTGLRGFVLYDCLIDHCEFRGLNIGAEIFGNNAIPLIKNNFLELNNTGIYVHEMDQVIIRDNIIQEHITEGIRLEQIDQAELTSNALDGMVSGDRFTDDGIVLDEVNTAWVANTFIKHFQFNGIRGHHSNVIMSAGSSVDDNGTGVLFENNATAEWALSVGTCSCADIINNDTGMKGDNMVLHIDAEENQMTCNSDTPLPPNRFDGNTTVFDICYTDLSFPILSPILMKGNYWGTQPVSAQGNYSIKAGSFCITVLTIDDSNAETDINQLSSCNTIQAPEPGDPKYPPSILSRTSCDVIESGTTYEVHEQSRLAFYDFYDKNFIAAQNGYQPVADLDPNTHNEASCVHKINFARCIVQALQNDQYASSKEDGWYENAMKINDNTNTVKITPNPATEVLHLLAPSDQNYQVQAYDVMGRLVYQQSFFAHHDIDITAWQRGLYVLAIVDNKGDRVQATKVYVF